MHTSLLDQALLRAHHPETHQWVEGLHFEVRPINLPPSGRGGIYVFAARRTLGMLNAFSSSWRAVYVGKCEDYAQRVGPGHHRLLDAMGLGATHVHVWDVTEPLRGEVEEFLITQLAPPLNDQHRPRGLLETAMYHQRRGW
jgi:hypothetical protein